MSDKMNSIPLFIFEHYSKLFLNKYFLKFTLIFLIYNLETVLTNISKMMINPGESIKITKNGSKDRKSHDDHVQNLTSEDKSNKKNSGMT